VPLLPPAGPPFPAPAAAARTPPALRDIRRRPRQNAQHGYHRLSDEADQK